MCLRPFLMISRFSERPLFAQSRPSSATIPKACNVRGYLFHSATAQRGHKPVDKNRAALVAAKKTGVVIKQPLRVLVLNGSGIAAAARPAGKRHAGRR